MRRFNRLICCLLALCALLTFAAPFRAFADEEAPISFASSRVGINFEGKCEDKKLILRGYVDNDYSFFYAGACALKFDPTKLSINTGTGVKKANDNFRILEARAKNESGDFSMEFAYVDPKAEMLAPGATQTQFVELTFDLADGAKMSDISEESVKLSEDETYFIDLGTCFKDNGALTVYDINADDVKKALNTKTLKNHGAESSYTDFNNPFSTKVTGVSVTPASSTITVGKTLALTANIIPTNAANKGVKWTSSDPSVATVSENGVVTGVKAGTATITVTTDDGGKTATSKITVSAEKVSGESVTGVTLSPASATVAVGKSVTLSPNVLPSNASNKQVTWTSSDPSVATVSANGVVKGIKPGTATITVRTADGGYTAAAAVTVVNGSTPTTPTTPTSPTKPYDPPHTGDDVSHKAVPIAVICSAAGAALAFVFGVKINKAKRG